MAAKVYVDTSVIGGILDPEFQFITRRFFRLCFGGHYKAVVSNVVSDEISFAPEPVQRFFNRLGHVADAVSITPEATLLAHRYLRHGKFSPRLEIDCTHVALATLNHIGIIASWNFKHIVNLDRIRVFNSVNSKLGYPLLEIRSPRDLLYEEDI
jgi:hypothetical protein